MSEASKARKDARKARAREKREAKATRYDALFAPWLLAGSGALVSLAFLFQQSTLLKAFLFIVFFIVAKASGKKVSLLTTLFVSLGIIAANLLVPLGKVIATWGPLTITETALVEGIGKAITFEGLIYISKASIRQGLNLPGRFGSIVGAAFVYYDRIIEYRGKIHAASLFNDVDELMLKIASSTSNIEESGPASAQIARRPIVGYVLAAFVVCLSFAALVLPLILR
jgi:hypothetical protein